MSGRDERLMMLTRRESRSDAVNGEHGDTAILGDVVVDAYIHTRDVHHLVSVTAIESIPATRTVSSGLQESFLPLNVGYPPHGLPSAARQSAFNDKVPPDIVPIIVDRMVFTEVPLFRCARNEQTALDVYGSTRASERVLTPRTTLLNRPDCHSDARPGSDCRLKLMIPNHALQRQSTSGRRLCFRQRKH